MMGTMLRYRTKTNVHSKQIMNWESAISAQRETTVRAAPDGYVLRGIPSAELATE